MDPSPHVYQHLALCLRQCQAWAESGCQSSLMEVAHMFPPWPHTVPFDVTALAIVFCKPETKNK